MKLYPLSEIIIPENRQRQEFEAQAMEELRQSILDRGLMQAPVIREEGGKAYLVAGERRLRSIMDIHALGEAFCYDTKLVPEGMVPTVTLGELDPLAAEEAELDENLKRKDLTWQELANAHTRLHNLRKRQKAAIPPKEYGEGNDKVLFQQTQSYADTAREVFGKSEGSNQDTIRKEVIVSRHLDKPEVAKAKTLDEAWKILKRSEQSEAHRQLAATVGATFNAGVHRVFNEPCLQWMRKALDNPAERFDVILIDSPYGMGADQFGDGAGKLSGIEHRYDDSYEAWKELHTQWAPLSFAITKPEAHLYMFCDIDRFHELRDMMQKAGWWVHRTPLIDYKTDSGRVPWPEHGPRRQWEMILYAVKGKKPVTHIYGDVIPCQADDNMTHGAQKPVALYANLLKRSVKPGDRVLDTFAGSGTIIPACHQLQCEATAVEKEPEYYGMCLNRLRVLREAADPLEGLK